MDMRIQRLAPAALAAMLAVSIGLWPGRRAADAQATSPLAPQAALRCASGDLRAALEEVTAHEVEARQAENWEAFQTLVHPEAEPQWQEQQESLLDPALEAIDLVRVEQYEDWALATAIVTYAETQEYTARVFRQDARGCWLLMSPSPEAWGSEQPELVRTGFSIAYRAFDEPYVRAVAPRLERVLPQMIARLGLELPEEFQFAVTVTPFPGQMEADIDAAKAQVQAPSPLSIFPISAAQSPEEFLLGYVADSLGHALLDIAFGEQAAEAPRLAVAHGALQWEVEKAVGRDNTAQRVAQLDGDPTPLASLLDLETADATGNRQTERELFFRFAAATYGEEIAAPFLRAVFASDSPEELAQAAFDAELAEVEAQWQKWLAQQQAAVAATQTE